jgi:hypothetical protein
MKQYRVTYNVDTGEGPDCFLDPADPLHKMKEEMFLGKIPGINTYEVYPEAVGEEDCPQNPYSQH